MVILDNKKLIFIHIPKCGGTSIRNSLQCVNGEKKLITNKVVEISGRKIDMVHLTIDGLKKYSKEDFDKVKEYDSFAIMRNPYTRFESSVKQALKRKGIDTRNIDKKTFINETHILIQKLLKYDEKLMMYELVHFRKQCDYIIYKGERLVKNIFLLDDTKKIENYLSEKYEIDISIGVHNKSLIYKNILFYILNNLGKKIIPKIIKSKLKGWWTNIAFKKRSDSIILHEEDVIEFIEHYYQKDISLYESIKSS